MRDSESDIASQARLVLLISGVATFALYQIPQLHVIAYPLVLISTLVHELGHGVAGLLAGGTFERFVMYSDGSGTAFTHGSYGRLGDAFVSAGGLVGPALGAAIMFVCARRATTARWCLATMGILLTVTLVMVTRNGFGVVFVGITAAVLLVLGFKASPRIAQLSLMFLAVQLALSVFSRGDYLFKKEAQTATGMFPSDSQQMATAMGFMPYWFWGAMCGAFSILVLAAGAWYLLRGTRKDRAALPAAKIG